MCEVARSSPALPEVAGQRLEVSVLLSKDVEMSAVAFVSARVAAPRSVVGFPVSVVPGSHT